MFKVRWKWDIKEWVRYTNTRVTRDGRRPSHWHWAGMESIVYFSLLSILLSIVINIVSLWINCYKIIQSYIEMQCKFELKVSWSVEPISLNCNTADDYYHTLKLSKVSFPNQWQIQGASTPPFFWHSNFFEWYIIAPSSF